MCISGCGHITREERAAEVNDAMIGFIQHLSLEFGSRELVGVQLCSAEHWPRDTLLIS
jgi:hypothetical protein